MNQEKPNLPGYVVLGRKQGANAYQGVIESSFNLDLSDDRVRFFWTFGEATSNILPGTFKVDGFENAEEMQKYFTKRYPDMEFEIFDVHDEDIPFTFDWDQWRKDKTPNKETISGVRNKFGARNVKFEMK